MADQPSVESDYAPCPMCGRRIAPRMDGRPRAHKPRKGALNDCPGGGADHGTPPEREVVTPGSKKPARDIAHIQREKLLRVLQEMGLSPEEAVAEADYLIGCAKERARVLHAMHPQKP